MLKIVLLWLFPLIIWANNAPLSVIKLPPSKVFVGAYINQISNINLKTNNFDVDMYLWFRWDDPKLTPDKTFWIVGGKHHVQSGKHRKTSTQWGSLCVSSCGRNHQTQLECHPFPPQ